MIEYIHGDLTELTPAMAVVETAGVGYGLNISLNTYTAIQGKQEVKLYVHEFLVAGGRDDSFTLFGFASKQERELYRQLITVSGVGGNTARMILSSMSPSELCNVISTGNEKMLKTVKGIGLKTAQRIIIDLKDKIVSLGIADELPANGGNVVMVNNGVKDEAVSALTMLGFSPAPSAKVVADILKAQPDLPVEQVGVLSFYSGQTNLSPVCLISSRAYFSGYPGRTGRAPRPSFVRSKVPFLVVCLMIISLYFTTR